jgi:hypothetical protein
MYIEMQCGPAPDYLTHSGWKTGIVGDVLDDRGTEAIEFIKKNCDTVCTLNYDPRSLNIELDDMEMSVDDIESPLKDFCKDSLILETTTLRVDEIFLCCKVVQQMGISSISLLYTEPQRYNRFRKSEVLYRRDFDLSTEYEPFAGIPGSMLTLNIAYRKKAIFLVGYEGQRFKKVLDQQDIRPENSYVVFGVPAFQPGWEMDAFANNLRVIKGEGIGKNVLFAGAQNPVSVIEALEQIYGTLGQNEYLVVVPIGTKPHGIGAALFVCQHDDVGIIYDHPNRKPGRSSQVGTWHLFNVTFG